MQTDATVAISRADHRWSPPRIEIPDAYNAAHDLIARNLLAGRTDQPALIDDQGPLTYGALARRVEQFASALVALGVQPEQRVLLCLPDSRSFPITFLGCILAGIVPVPVNTMLTAADYTHLLGDSRARAVVVAAELWPAMASAATASAALRHVIVDDPGQGIESTPSGACVHSLSDLLDGSPTGFGPAPTHRDEPCFWLYSSGSTGRPKGTIHRHAGPILTAELFARPILGLRAGDRVFSAAKLFFAYGLGNALSYPMAVGATSILMRERATPAAVISRLLAERPDVFCGVPTLFASLLAHPALPTRDDLSVRICTSAGEALPADLGRRWTERFGVEILDGIGSTEMLHVFLTNQPGKVRYGTTGTPIPGFETRVVDDRGCPVDVGEIGELQVRGPTAALGYWNNRDKTRDTFQGWWTRCGDKFSVDADGYHSYAGRTDDMLKVGGIYVSPVEVESALITHPAVLEVAVVGRADAARLIKPAAYVVLEPGHPRGEALAEALREHVKSMLAPYKAPRWVEFVDELPKTATGKIQRFKLRA